MLKSTFSNILFTTWYKSNVKNLEIYCQRLKKLLLQHCECAYKHSQTFYDPMNLQNNFCILCNIDKIYVLFFDQNDTKTNIIVLQSHLLRRIYSSQTQSKIQIQFSIIICFHVCLKEKNDSLRIFNNFWSSKTSIVIWK